MAIGRHVPVAAVGLRAGGRCHQAIVIVYSTLVIVMDD